jgi:cell division protein FtsL
MSLFDTSKRKEQQTPEKKPELKVATSSVAKSGRPVAVAIIGAVFLAVFVMFLYSKAALSEVNLKISNETQALSDAQSINTALSNQLSGSVSLENVEQYAVSELGMQKVSASQERYVEMNTGNMTETAKNDNDNIFVTVQDWFNGILEYLGF